MSAVPSGVVAIYVHEERVIANVTDFSQSKPAGFTVREAQEFRARRRLAREVIKELSSPLLYEHASEHICEQLLRNMPGTVHLLHIGGETEEEINGSQR